MRASASQRKRSKCSKNDLGIHITHIQTKHPTLLKPPSSSTFAATRHVPTAWRLGRFASPWVPWPRRGTLPSQEAAGVSPCGLLVSGVMLTERMFFLDWAKKRGPKSEIWMTSELWDFAFGMFSAIGFVKGFWWADNGQRHLVALRSPEMRAFVWNLVLCSFMVEFFLSGSTSFSGSFEVAKQRPSWVTINFMLQFPVSYLFDPQLSHWFLKPPSSSPSAKRNQTPTLSTTVRHFRQRPWKFLNNSPAWKPLQQHSRACSRLPCSSSKRAKLWAVWSVSKCLQPIFNGQRSKAGFAGGFGATSYKQTGDPPDNT